MGKTIRPTYPAQFSIGLLLLIFAISFFLSSQVFAVKWKDLLEGNTNVYFGMFLVSAAVIIMMLILWEEFLFPIKFKPAAASVVFRNHRNKLKTQLLIYCAIPIIFSFIYFEYEVKLVRFIIWAGICTIAPVAGKLISGIKNYNDFLKLTNDAIEYKNNAEVGIFLLTDIQHIKLIKDERNILHKIQLLLTNNHEVTIDLDEMELEDFYDSIDKSIAIHYQRLLIK
jgi:hypothetical protein